MRRLPRTYIAGAILLAVGAVMAGTLWRTLSVRWTIISDADRFAPATFVVTRVVREPTRGRGRPSRWLALGTVNGRAERLDLGLTSPRWFNHGEAYAAEFAAGSSVPVLYRGQTPVDTTLLADPINVVPMRLAPTGSMRFSTYALTALAGGVPAAGVVLLLVGTLLPRPRNPR